MPRLNLIRRQSGRLQMTTTAERRGWAEASSDSESHIGEVNLNVHPPYVVIIVNVQKIVVSKSNRAYSLKFVAFPSMHSFVPGRFDIRTTMRMIILQDQYLCGTLRRRASLQAVVIVSAREQCLATLRVCNNLIRIARTQSTNKTLEQTT